MLRRCASAIFCFASLVPVISGIRVLFLGDSVDRFSTNDWCEKHTGRIGKVWTTSSLVYFHGEPAGYICDNQELNVSVASLHIFGSNATGHYHREGELRKFPSNVVDTAPRIKEGVRLYLSQFPMPDVVFYNMALWDFEYLVDTAYRGTSVLTELSTPGSPTWQRMMTEYYHLVHDRRQDIIDSFRQYPGGDQVNVGLQTSVFYPLRSTNHPLCDMPSKMFSLFGLNEVIRTIWRNYKNDLSAVFPMFDYDEEVWSKYQHNYSICGLVFADYNHPTVPHRVDKVDIILGLKYNHLYKFPTAVKQKMPHDIFHYLRWSKAQGHFNNASAATITESFGVPIQRIYVVREKEYGHKYAVHNFTGPHHHPFSPTPRRLLSISASDDIALDHKWSAEEQAVHTYFISYDSGSESAVGPETGVRNISIQRHAGVLFDQLTKLNLGPADIYYATAEELSLLPLGPSLTEKYGSVVDSTKTLLVYHPAKGTSIMSHWLLVPNDLTKTSYLARRFAFDLAGRFSNRRDVALTSFLLKYGPQFPAGTTPNTVLTRDLLTCITSRLDRTIFANIPVGREIPDIYRSEALMRSTRSGNIFVNLNGERHSVAKPHTLEAHHWSFRSILVVHKDDIDLIPQGHPLTK